MRDALRKDDYWPDPSWNTKSLMPAGRQTILICQSSVHFYQNGLLVVEKDGRSINDNKQNRAITFVSQEPWPNRSHDTATTQSPLMLFGTEPSRLISLFNPGPLLSAISQCSTGIDLCYRS